MTLLARFVLFPATPDEPISAWSLDDEGGLTADIEPTPDDDTVAKTIALVMPEHVVIRTHQLVELSPRQAEAAAKIEAGSASVDGSSLHISSEERDGRTISACIDRRLFEFGIGRLASAGFDPDEIWPVGLLLSDNANSPSQLRLGGKGIIRSGGLIFSDEQGIRDILLEPGHADNVPEVELPALLRDALQDSPINMRTAEFAKRGESKAADLGRLKLAGWLFTIGVLLSLTLAIATWIKIDLAIERENQKALDIGRRLSIEAQSADEVKAKLDQRLVAEGLGARSFTVPAAALWQSIRNTDGVNLRELRLGADRILAATVTATSVDPVNKLLSDLQRQGFKVTATPRQEANGLTAVAITMRVP